MAFKLPPMNSLRLFEAAGRHGSFKGAASELNVTPSAVSHGIQMLEDWLGTPLFLRGKRGLELTDAGRVYLATIRDVLAKLDEATRRNLGNSEPESVRLSVTPSFASRWLMPRIDALLAACPGISLDLDTSLHHLDLTGDSIDIAIRMSARPPDGLAAIRLIRESFVPVAAPALLSRIGGGNLAATLSAAPLLHVTTVSEDWDNWFRKSGIARPEKMRAIHLDSALVALEAAIRGSGITLGRRPLIDDDLASGRLEEIGAPTIEGETSFWLMGSDRAFRRRGVRSFRRWLLAEIAASGPETKAIKFKQAKSS